MKLTKFQHACFLVEKEGTAILVDPGEFTGDLIIPKKIDAIVITHEHSDHFDEKTVRSLLETHSQAVLYAHESVTGRFTDSKTVTVYVGEVYAVGVNTLQFFGGCHAPTTEGIPVPVNYGVLINDTVYYPGDSFVLPDRLPIAVLALPVSAPWLRIDDSIALLKIARPRIVFPTHDAILSEEGKTIADRLVGAATNALGAQYRRLDSSSIEL